MGLQVVLKYFAVEKTCIKICIVLANDLSTRDRKELPMQKKWFCLVLLQEYMRKNGTFMQSREEKSKIEQAEN